MAILKKNMSGLRRYQNQEDMQVSNQSTNLWEIITRCFKHLIS